MSKKMLLLINPKAGRSSFRDCLGDVAEVFGTNDYLPTVYFTHGPGDATKIVAANGGDYDIVTCIGGDGTLSETVAGMMRLTSPPPLGYIPMGTANDVAATLAIPRSPLKAAQQIVSGRPLAIDIGSFGGEGYFTYIAAFGAFTGVSYETPQENKHALGHLAYFLEGVAQLPRITPCRARVEYDGGVIEDEFVFGGVANSTSIAGLVKLDETVVSLTDGMFELILVRNPRNLHEMNRIVGDIVWRSYEGGQVTVLHTKSAKFTLDEAVAWTRDGESGGVHKELELRNCHRAVEIIV